MHFARIVSGFIYLNLMYYSAECWRSTNTRAVYRKIVHAVSWFMGTAAVFRVRSSHRRAKRQKQ